MNSLLEKALKKIKGNQPEVPQPVNEEKKPSTLDLARPYGQVCGQSVVRYEQDGKSFDAHGVEIL